MGKHLSKRAYLLTTVLIALLTPIILMPYFTHITEASGINTVLTVPGQTVKLVYEYDFSLSVVGVGKTPVKMLVVQHYIINIGNYNRTYVEVSGEPVGNISVLFSSNSWIPITALMKTMSQNVTKLIEGLSLRTIHPSFISKKDFSFEIAKVMYVSPIVTLGSSASCINLTLNGVFFKAVEISSGISGIAYYECKTGVLLKYTSKTIKDINNGNVSLHIVKDLDVNLVGGDNETLKLLGGSQLTQTPSESGGVINNPLIIGILAGSIAAFAISLFYLVRVYRSARHQK